MGDVEMIVITHAHVDHIDNLPQVRGSQTRRS